MRTILRNKRIMVSMVSAAVVFILYLFVGNDKSAEQLASAAKYAPQFFELSKSDFFASNGEMYVIDELHSQGRNFEDFGSAHYEIKLREPHQCLIKEIEDKGGIHTDTTWILTKLRGNIRGELVVASRSSKAYVHYYQIYSE